MDKQNIKAFISYAHKDKRYFKNIVHGLKSHSKQSKVFNWEIWDDRQIVFGYDWNSEIQGAIEECDFAILFISPDFINSDFCTTDELGEFIKRNIEKGFLFFPILVRDCDFTQLEKVAKKQLFVAHGDDYGFPKKEGEMIAYAELVRYDTEGALIPNPNIDTYHKNLVGAIEEALLRKKKVNNKENKIKESTIKNQINQEIGIDSLIQNIKNNIKNKIETIDDKESLYALKIKLHSEIFDEINKSLGHDIADILFERILSTSKLEIVDINTIHEIRKSDKFHYYEKVLIVSALTLSLFREFNITKIDLLIDFLADFEHEVWQYALVGLLLTMADKDKRLPFYKDTYNRLQKFQEIEAVQDGLTAISLVLFSEIYKIQVLPLGTYSEQNILGINLPSVVLNFLDLINNDFLNLIKDGLLNNQKQQQIIVNLFETIYQKPQNWFLPFYENNPLLNATLSETTINIDYEELETVLKNKFLLTDLEKYNLCINIKDNEDYKEIVKYLLKMFAVLTKNLSAQINDPIKIDFFYSYSNIVKSYYLFFINYPKKEFNDFFKEKIDVKNSTIIEIISSQKTKDKLGEIYELKDVDIKSKLSEKDIGLDNLIENLSENIKVSDATLLDNLKLGKGVDLFISKNIKEAQKVFQECIETTNKEVALCSLGHIELCLKNEKSAIDYYKQSIPYWSSINDFFKSFEDDYEYVKLYDIDKEYYFNLMNKLKSSL